MTDLRGSPRGPCEFEATVAVQQFEQDRVYHQWAMACMMDDVSGIFMSGDMVVEHMAYGDIGGICMSDALNA